MPRVLALALLFALGATAAADAAPASSFRLPPVATPSRYQVTLTPDFAAKTFHGTERVSLRVRQATRRLVLDAHGLKASQVWLDGRLAGVARQLDEQNLAFEFPRAVLPGQHTLSLAFSGVLGDEPRGLYLQPYQAGGKPHTMLASQCEATDARRIFPLWDEPAYRAVFELSLDLPQGYEGLSNMPIRRQSPAPGGLTRVSFKPTPPMASYLLVLCGGEFESISSRIAGVDCRVVTTPGKKETGRFALEALAKLLPYYNDYFGVRYPLPKLDLVAIPGGFSGAMENWGGILFQDGTLLYDPHLSSERDREFIFQIVAHEVAHQWFGNLVTMAWWDDLWLNEGFANWMETNATMHFHPDWPVWLAAADKKDRALLADALLTTHPVQQPIADATQADAAFDDITYDKGEAVIRMLETAMGPAAFRTGIRRYMRAHQYGNARTTDLWQALATATRLPVRTLAPRWITTPGFPLISASRQGGAIALTQERFTLNGTAPQGKPWPIPLLYQLDGVSKTTLFDQPALGLGPSSGLLKLNAGGGGVYRVRYDEALLAQLEGHFQQLGEADRVNLVQDAWALAQADKLSARELLQVLELGVAGASAPVSEASLGNLEPAVRVYGAKRDTDGVSGRFRRALAPLYQRLGWSARPTDRAIDRALRASVLTDLGRYGDPAVIAEARQRFTAGGAALDGDVRKVVLAVVGRNARPADHAELLKRARQADGFEEKRQLYEAAADASDPALARLTLPLVLPGELDPTLAGRVLYRLGSLHPALAREFVAAHQEALYAKRTPLDRLSLWQAAYAQAADPGDAAAFTTAVRASLPGEVWPEADKTAEQLRVRAAFATRLRPALAAWARRGH